VFDFFSFLFIYVNSKNLLLIKIKNWIKLFSTFYVNSSPSFFFFFFFFSAFVDNKDKVFFLIKTKNWIKFFFFF
jgi:hypothetical protein